MVNVVFVSLTCMYAVMEDGCRSCALPIVEGLPIDLVNLQRLFCVDRGLVTLCQLMLHFYVNL